MKFLLWVLVAIVVVLWLMRDKKGSAGTSVDTPVTGADTGAEPMVRCTHCGTYVPQSEAIVAPSGASFCSKEHRLRHDSPESRA